jgi:hypothetical protein
LLELLQYLAAGGSQRISEAFSGIPRLAPVEERVVAMIIGVPES